MATYPSTSRNPWDILYILEPPTQIEWRSTFSMVVLPDLLQKTEFINCQLAVRKWDFGDNYSTRTWNYKRDWMDEWALYSTVTRCSGDIITNKLSY